MKTGQIPLIIILRLVGLQRISSGCQSTAKMNGNPPGSTVWANFPIFILSNIRASHRCNKSWKMIRINRSIFPIFATSMTNTSVRQDESGKRNHKR